MQALDETLNRIKRDLLNKQLNVDSEQTLTDSKCPLCDGKEWTIHEEDGIYYADECPCRQKRIQANMLRFADIPPAYTDAVLKTFRVDVYRDEKSKNTVRVACKTIKVYLEEFDQLQEKGMGLYIYSLTKGSGKTRMAASIANELIGRGKVVKFTTSTAILNEIKRTWDKESAYTESSLLDHLTTTEILMIDDFGTEKATGWVSDKFYQIVNERYIRKKVTLFTSNETLDSLPYDSRITNRIQETTYQIQFPEESIREHIAESNNTEILERIKAGI